MNNALIYANAQAITPDQLLYYVSSVSNMQSELVGDYIVHKQGTKTILIGYNLQDPHNTEQLDDVIQQLISSKEGESITVLAPLRPNIAPDEAISSKQDAYWFLPLPIAPSSKVRNMLNNAQNHVYITKKSEKNAWSGEHQELMLEHIRQKSLDSAQCTLLHGLEKYILSSSDVLLFSAYSNESKKLLACAIADFSSFTTAFYMFAFRHESAHQGTSDALLFALLEEAATRGYTHCNLGLGINEGIRFFKNKWGAKPSLPFFETTWQIGASAENIEKDTKENPKKKSWFSKLLG